MILEKLAALLLSTGLPVTYHSWPEDEDVPDLPYICYLITRSNPTFADGKVYYLYEDVQVELYVKELDPALEETVETSLAGYHWEKNRAYISTDRCWMVSYEIEV